ncbi:hypothetical protein Tco_0082572, partial [Tanacetum coccineum]
IQCRNSTPEIAGRSKDGSGPESVASVLLGDEGAATTSKIVKAEPHSCSQLRAEGDTSEGTKFEPDNSYVRGPFAKPKRPTKYASTTMN